MPDVFITEDFLLESDAARELYHAYAAPMPIIDYHCHIPPQQVAEDHQFRNMTEAWLGGDHYKWRLMRTWGVPEQFITGDAPDRDKFQKWAETVPHILRNPIYHWNHLELRKPFGIADRLFGPDTAEGIWEHCNALLATPEFAARGIMKQWDVVLICTTDDPVDSLEHHQAIADDPDFAVQVLPAFRPDKGMAIGDVEAFNGWVDRLAAASDVDIRDLASYREAIRRRYEYFHAHGCRLSDHGIANFVAEPYTEAQVAAIFARARGGSAVGPDEALKFQSAMLYEFSVLNAEMGWTQQYHIAAIRNNNRRLFRTLGPDVGGDSIADHLIAEPMSRLLGRLDDEGKLARTIVYSLNPTHNAVLASMIGNFQDGSCRAKLQLGSAWWFNDTLSGMLEQIEVVSNLSMLAPFVGMLTDSRSFLSYARHEYFRRLLCNLLGGEIERGLLPRDFALVGSLVRDVSYRNASTWFGFEGLPQA